MVFILEVHKAKYHNHATQIDLFHGMSKIIFIKIVYYDKEYLYFSKNFRHITLLPFFIINVITKSYTVHREKSMIPVDV